MRLKITSIRDAGNIEKERVVLKAESSADVGAFLLIQAGYFDDSVTNGVEETYWFPDKEVAEGDFIVLYTKSGKMSDKQFRDVHSHFFYWGLNDPIWKRPNKCPVLMYAPTWESFKSEP